MKKDEAIKSINECEDGSKIWIMNQLEPAKQSDFHTTTIATLKCSASESTEDCKAKNKKSWWN